MHKQNWIHKCLRTESILLKSSSHNNAEIKITDIGNAFRTHYKK